MPGRLYFRAVALTCVAVLGRQWCSRRRRSAPAAGWERRCWPAVLGFWQVCAHVLSEGRLDTESLASLGSSIASSTKSSVCMCSVRPALS